MATFYTYAKFIQSIMDEEIDWEADTIKLALTTSSYTPDQDTHDYFDDVTNEVSGTGYTAGGATLTSKTIANTENVTKVDAADVTWSSSTITARICVLYMDTGTASTSPLIGYCNFGEDKSSENGNFTVQFDSDGIFTFTNDNAV